MENNTLVPEPNFLSRLYANHYFVTNDKIVRRAFLDYLILALACSSNFNSNYYNDKQISLCSMISIYYNDNYVFTDARIELIKKIAKRETIIPSSLKELVVEKFF
jgi:hypothetical protein